MRERRLPKRGPGKTSARFPTFRDQTHIDPKQHLENILKTHNLKNISAADRARLLAKVTELVHGSPAGNVRPDEEFERLLNEIKARKKVN